MIRILLLAGLAMTMTACNAESSADAKAKVEKAASKAKETASKAKEAAGKAANKAGEAAKAAGKAAAGAAGKAAEKTAEVAGKAADKLKAVAGGGNTVTLSGNDQMQFDTKEITVKAGAKVTLTLKHTGKMPKAAMGHNFVLLKAGTDLAAFSKEAIAAGADNNYVPKSDAVLASTKVIGGGESTSITFDAPPAGTYDFICSFPGHYAVMKGKFIVK